MSKHLIEDAVILHITRESDGTPKGVCFRAPEFDEDVWMPYNQIHDDSEVYKEGDKGDLVVKEWWAKKQGWVD